MLKSAAASVQNGELNAMSELKARKVVSLPRPSTGTLRIRAGLLTLAGAIALASATPATAIAASNQDMTSQWPYLDRDVILPETVKFAGAIAPPDVGDQNKVDVDDQGNAVSNPNFYYNFPHYSLYANPFQTPEREAKERSDAASGWGILPLKDRLFCLSLQGVPIYPWRPNERHFFEFVYNSPPDTYSRLATCVGGELMELASGGS